MPEALRRAAGDASSVFLTDFPAADPAWKDDELLARWERIWEIRGTVTRALEEKRRAGEIGQSLEARVVLSVPAGDAAVLEALGERGLCEVLIVSQVEVKAGAAALEVAVEKARGSKCGRCWNYAEDVGAHADHPVLCGRCHGVVASS
jgi:isoleucyl-tRNA synthetase